MFCLVHWFVRGWSSVNVLLSCVRAQAFIRTVDQRGLQVSTQVKRRLALRGWRQRGTCATWQPWVVHHAGWRERWNRILRESHVFFFRDSVFLFVESLDRERGVFLASVFLAVHLS